MDPEVFYAAINRAKPTLIRVEADELTYNLHIMVRFEIEQDVIEGRTRVEDLPAVWNDKVKSYLGIVPRNDAEGVLQDVHWSLGAFGYFPTYTLGNLYAAQLYEQVQKEIPNLDAEIEAGRLTVLTKWFQSKDPPLGPHVHRRTSHAARDRGATVRAIPEAFREKIWGAVSTIVSSDVNVVSLHISG